MIHKNTDLTLYLIRHGESHMNQKPELIGGRSDQALLSETGKTQAKKLGERFVNENILFNAIYSSPIYRSKMTAEITLQELCVSNEKIVAVEALAELAQGEWEGRSRKDVYSPEILHYINAKGSLFVPPGGESQMLVEHRVSSWFINEVLHNPRYIENESTVAIFSHGIAIKCFLHFVMNFDQRFIYRMTLDNTSICKLRLTKEGWIIDSINDTAHLYKS